MIPCAVTPGYGSGYFPVTSLGSGWVASNCELQITEIRRFRSTLNDFTRCIHFYTYLDWCCIINKSFFNLKFIKTISEPTKQCTYTNCMHTAYRSVQLLHVVIVIVSTALVQMHMYSLYSSQNIKHTLQLVDTDCGYIVSLNQEIYPVLTQG